MALKQPLKKVLRMRALHNLHSQLMYRENEMTLCTIAIKAKGETGQCQCKFCKKNRAEVEQIEKRIDKIEKRRVELKYAK